MLLSGKTRRSANRRKLLLHYNYGAAAVKWWGRGVELLEKHAKLLVNRARSTTNRIVEDYTRQGCYGS